jgi:hypothetical protein
MDNYPYSAVAFVCRRELEPSMLNGDAHHSLAWEVELRIGRCRFINPPANAGGTDPSRSPQRITQEEEVMSHES